jgi:hypothetical protein
MAGYVLETRRVAPVRQGRSQVYRDAVSRFLDNPDLLAVRVELGKRPDAAYVGLRNALGDLGADGAVRVVRRRDTLWLVRIGEW